MMEEVVKPSSQDVPFAPSPSETAVASHSFSSIPASGAKKGTIIGAATAGCGKTTHGASFTAAGGDADPYALLYSNPSHAPPSLIQRTHGTESLFQYYIQRGYKELLTPSTSADADKAVEACLEGKANAGVDTAAGGQQSNSPQEKTQPKNTHVIDRCLAERPTGVPAPLRPPQARDKNSLYVSQQADEERAEVKARRRTHLRQPPSGSIYAGRYYPPGIDVLPIVVDSSAPKSAGLATRRSPSASLNHSTSLMGAACKSPALPPTQGSGGGEVSSVRGPTFARPDGGAPGRTPSLIVPLRTPEEAAAEVAQQRETRRLLAQQIEEAFAAAHHARDTDPGAVAANDAATADGVSEGSKKRASTAASRSDGEKKRKSTVRAVSAAGGVLTPIATGGVPANLSLFCASLLLLSNEDGAVTLDQLCTTAANVPFNIPPAGLSAPVGGAMQKLFRILHANTRAPNATDATDLLLAVASATGRQMVGVANDNSLSYGPTTASGGGNVNSGTRGGTNNTPSSGNGRRALGTSVSNAAAAGATPNRGPRTSILGTSRGVGSPTSVSAQHQAPPPTASVSFARSTHTSKNHPPGASGAWKDIGSSLGTSARQQSTASASAELKDSRKCVLVLEVLDALDALLNSPETREVVRWECFAVLAVEGHGYIHKSQLVLLRRHAYRDGSASEENAAVTASMVRALEDAFSVMAAEEEAAYVKANKKGRKGGAAGGANLNSNQRSAIPLHMMRKSHMNFPLFCRFFDELPQMPAAFAHVWFPMLLDGVRWQSTVSSSPADDEENGIPSTANAIPADGLIVGDAENTDAPAVRMGGRSETACAASPAAPKSFSFLGGGSGNDEGFPLELLGSTPSARQAVIQRLLTRRLEHLQDACDALEKEKLQEETSAGSGTFGSPEATSSN